MLFLTRHKPAPSANLSAILIVEHGRMPTTDYFLLPKAKIYGVPVAVLDSSAVKEDSLQPGTLVVFVRYLEKATKKLVLNAAAQGQLAGVVYFMDDDLLDPASWGNIPPKYTKKLRQLAPTPKWLLTHGIKLWVSSPFLKKKYLSLDPELIEPHPEEQLYSRRTGTRIFYHGTASHTDEINWLAPIIRHVQMCGSDTTFEIIGDLSVNRLYRDIPRTSILYPMSWENYRAYSSCASLHVGLVPLLDSPFNQARSITKFFDTVRCGAVGIYSNREPFRSFIRDGEDGLLIDNQPDAWVQAILSLANTPELRERLYRNAVRRALAISNAAA